MTAANADTEKKPAPSPWSLQIASIAGIPIRLHFTFLLFLGWIGIVGEREGSFVWPILVVAVFVCVLLHELGHALAGLQYGVKTQAITLYPIGGVALLESRPKPRAELVIALAGPMVNVVIALVLLAIGLATSPQSIQWDALVEGKSFLGTLMISNFGLAIFNLIPAFPMDGGRVLRAALAINMSERRATQIAATIGQGLAVIFGFAGLFAGAYPLMLIALFVFLGAGQEAQATVTRSFLDGHVVRDAMQTRYRTIGHGENIETAAQMLLAGSQHDFPVVAGDETVGILTRNDIARGIAAGDSSLYVSEVMERDFRRATEDEPLESVLALFSKGNQTPVLIMEGESLVGLLTSENVSEFIMLEAARDQSRRS